MQRFCPTCGTALSPDDLDIDRALATCRACNSVTGVDQFGLQPVGTRAPPATQRRKRQEVPRPSHFSVKDDGSSLRIRFRWIWRRFTGAATMCLVWNCFVVGWYWAALRTPEKRMMWFALVWCLPHAAIGLLLVYATLAGLLNRTVIKATSECLTVRNGPVPWWGNRRLLVDQLERLVCQKDAAEAGHGWIYVYCVNALTKEGGKVDLITELDSAQALFVKQELERWLKIGGRAVGRAIHC
jgi:hypothetical protein